MPTNGIKTSQITRIESANARRASVRSGSDLQRGAGVFFFLEWLNWASYIEAMSGMELYAPATPPGIFARNFSGSLFPNSFVRTVEPFSMRTVISIKTVLKRSSPTNGDTKYISKIPHKYIERQGLPCNWWRKGCEHWEYGRGI